MNCLCYVSIFLQFSVFLNGSCIESNEFSVVFSSDIMTIEEDYLVSPVNKKATGPYKKEAAGPVKESTRKEKHALDTVDAPTTEK